MLLEMTVCSFLPKNLLHHPTMPEFSHLNANNNPAIMDVWAKTTTRRTARARSVVTLSPSSRVICRHRRHHDFKPGRRLQEIPTEVSVVNLLVVLLDIIWALLEQDCTYTT